MVDIICSQFGTDMFLLKKLRLEKFVFQRKRYKILGTG